MKRLLQLILLFISIVANGQVKINGSVKRFDGKPISGANISLKDTYDGATSDSLGFYSFTTTEKGRFVLSVSAPGFLYTEDTILISSASIVKPFILNEELSEITITARKFEADDKSKSVTLLNSLDIATVGGAGADISSAMKTMPGTQQVGEREGLFVRGGTGTETKQFIDGTLVNNPYFATAPDIGARGRFSPFLFKGTVFSTGGYSAQYGQALSSALILESIDLPEKSHIDASVSPLVWGGAIQHLAKNEKSSWGASYNYVNLGLYFYLVKQKPDYFKIPTGHNSDFNFRIKTKKGIVKFYSALGIGDGGLSRPDIDSILYKDALKIHNFNWYSNLSWRENLGNGWKFTLGLSYSTNRDHMYQELQDSNKIPQAFPNSYFLMNKNFNLKSRQDLSQIKLVLDKRLSSSAIIRFGGEYWYNIQRSIYTATYEYPGNLNDHFTALFVETDIHISNRLTVQAGGRSEYSSIIDQVNLAPRLSISYKTSANSVLCASYGIFYQKPENQQLIASPQLGYTKATHYIAYFQKNLKGRILRAEVFYKEYNNLIKTVPKDLYFSTYNNAGDGYAEGIEFFCRDNKVSVKNLDYWISYSYLDTKREFLNYPKKIQPNFAATHNASIVTKKFFPKYKGGINLTYTYSTGRPYYYFHLNEQRNYEIKDQGRAKDFHNVGLSLSYIPSMGKQDAKTFWVIFASVSNLLGSNQVYSYNYSYNGTVKQAVTPTAKRFFFIGVFLSWGVNRTQDAINNNL